CRREHQVDKTILLTMGYRRNRFVTETNLKKTRSTYFNVIALCGNNRECEITIEVMADVANLLNQPPGFVDSHIDIYIGAFKQHVPMAMVAVSNMFVLI